MLSYLPIHLHTRLRSTPLGARSFYCHISLVLDSAVRGAFKSRHGGGPSWAGWLAHLARGRLKLPSYKSVMYVLYSGALLPNQNIAGSANIYANEPRALLLSKINDGARISSCSVSWQGLEGALPAPC